MTSRRMAFSVVCLIAALVFGVRAWAQTADELIGRGTINIGVLTDLPPYGTVNAKGEPDGYDADVARLLARHLGVAPSLVPVTRPNRTPMLVSGKVDLIVAAYGITPERAKTVMFSMPYALIENVIFAPKGKALAKIEDLKPLRVGVPRATAADALLTAMLGRSAELTRFDDDTSTLKALATGQVDAIAEAGLTGDAYFRQTSAGPFERQFTLYNQPSGIAMRLNQWNLHQWVNTFLFYVKNNGELSALHEKWFNEKLPTLPTF